MVITTVPLAITKDLNLNFNQSTVNFILWIKHVTKSLTHTQKILRDRNLSYVVEFVTLVSFWDKNFEGRNHFWPIIGNQEWLYF